MDRPLPSSAPRAIVARALDDTRDRCSRGLREDGFDVEAAASTAALVAAARALPPDLIVADMALPDDGGIELCRALREFSDAYVILLADAPDEVQAVLALSVGADDVVAAGISPRELAARGRAMLRRPRQPVTRPGPLAVGNVLADPLGRSAGVDGRALGLTRLEFDLLAALLEEPHVVVERQRLARRVWGGGWLGDDHVLDVHISNLRRKLVEAGADHVIVTVRGVGFRMDPSG